MKIKRNMPFLYAGQKFTCENVEFITNIKFQTLFWSLRRHIELILHVLNFNIMILDIRDHKMRNIIHIYQ